MALSATVQVLTVSLKEAHEILAHPSFRILKEMVRNDRIGNLKITGPIEPFECDICKRAKSTVKPHAITSDRKAMFPGHIVCADIIDGRAINAHGGFKFASVIVDQYSYWTSVAILPDKSATSVLNHIKIFNTSLINLSGRIVELSTTIQSLTSMPLITTLKLSWLLQGSLETMVLQNVEVGH